MVAIWRKLKRRNVFRVGATYTVLGWLLIQIAATLLPTFGAPDWTMPVFTAIVILGLPLSIVLAWAYELTPDGIESGHQATLEDASSRRSRHVMNDFLLWLIFPALAYLVVSQYGLAQRTTISGSDSRISLKSNIASSSVGVRRYGINIGTSVPGPSTRRSADIALSPDGKRLVYSVQRSDDTPLQLYVYDFDQLEARLIPGTDGARTPFLSPDGEWIGFRTFGAGTLSKVAVLGGTPQRISNDGYIDTGAYWKSDDSILYTSDSFRLAQITSTGGAAELVAGIPEDSERRTWPSILPDGTSILFTTSPRTSAGDGRIDLLLPMSGEVRTLIQGGYNARYVPSGHIVFMRSAALWAVPFDLDRLEKTGPEVPVVQGVQTSSIRGQAAYAFSNDGLLVYLPGGDTQAEESSVLTWVDREGNEQVFGERRDYRWPVISPDGNRIAMWINDGGNEDIWIYELERDILRRLTFDVGVDSFPQWTPDGEQIVFGSTREGGGIWIQAADGTGQAQQLLHGPPGSYPVSFSPDGTRLIYVAGGNLFLLNLDGDAVSKPLMQNSSNENWARISPDGSWIAYNSDETGRMEVYVRPFPDIDGGKWQISKDGGATPIWGPDSRVLYFRSGNRVLEAAIKTDTTFSVGTVGILFSTAIASEMQTGFAVTADGSRFLLLKPQTETGSASFSEDTHLVAVENWFQELRRIALPEGQ